MGDKIGVATHAAPKSSLGGTAQRVSGKHGGIKQPGLGGAKEPFGRRAALVGTVVEEGGQGGEGLFAVGVDVIGVDPASSRGGAGPAGARVPGRVRVSSGGGGLGQFGGQGAVRGGSRAVLRAGYRFKFVWF